MSGNLIKANDFAMSGAVADGAGFSACATSSSHRTVGEVRPPEISLIRDGDVVRAIEITCPCGNTMVIECDYGEETTS